MNKQRGVVVLGMHRSGTSAITRGRKFVEEGFRRDEKPSPLEKGKGHGIVGDDDFVEQIKLLFGKEKETAREQPALREFGKGLAPEELIEQYLKLVGAKREDICAKGRQSAGRAMLMELLYRQCRITQPETRLEGCLAALTIAQ